MRAHYLQHVAFEGLGSIAAWLRGAGYTITGTKLFEDPLLWPDIDAIDLLIAMGGPMSVNDEDRFAWLVREKRFIRRAIDAGKPVLGVCLGAQLIASAMGAQVYRNGDREIGWFPVMDAAPSRGAGFRFPPSVEVLCFVLYALRFNLCAIALSRIA